MVWPLPAKAGPSCTPYLTLCIIYITLCLISYTSWGRRMSFRETSAWSSRISPLAVFGFYFTVVGCALDAGPVPPPAFLGEYIGAVVLLVIVQIVLHIIAAVATRVRGGD